MTDPTFLLMNPATLPTHIARVVGRVNQAGSGSSAESFLLTSYVVESAIKTIGVALCAGLRHTSSAALYRLEYELVRADGLGSWEAMISKCATQSYSGYLDKGLQPLLNWLSQKRTSPQDQWARDAVDACSQILSELVALPASVPNKLNMRYLISQFVQIRNKTKAHGAAGDEFFAEANPLYIAAVRCLVEHCPLFQWQWFFLAERQSKGNVKAVSLRGPSATHVPAQRAQELRPPNPGIYFRPNDRADIMFCGDLLRTGSECRSFHIPNGGMTNNGQAEYIDYGDGSVVHFDMSRLLAPPAPLPSSATEGASTLDIYSNVFGNLPPLPRGYIERSALQEDLQARLEDTNHSIITLHGRGGIGKTSLALYMAHKLAGADIPKFDHIIWLSARDLELKPTGASEVRRAVPNLDAVCRLLADFVDIDPTLDAFAELLQDPSVADSYGILFIFDNFETLDDPRGIHRFLDTHTHIPNKVLITSRERAFKGDFPIEVGGMEFLEAKELIHDEAILLDVAHIINEQAIKEIFDYTDGHAYVMRVVVGEIARDRRWVPLKSLVPRRSDLLGAVFERSFNKLTPEGRWVFLTVANWRSVISELALLVVLGRREIDVESGIEECTRLSLITRQELLDGQYCYFAPELARLFAKKKLDGDPDRLTINEDLTELQQFGPVKINQVGSANIKRMVTEFVNRSRELAASAAEGKRQKIDASLVRIADIWPEAWLDVAKYRREFGLGDEKIAYALRRGVEEMPFDQSVWLARADHAASMSDDATRIASLVSAVEANPKDVDCVREVALQLCKYVDSHKHDIPQMRRGVYLASVRSHMATLAEQLDATGLSRLAWLFLLEGDTQNALRYANNGLERESTNTYCQRIVDRLHDQGVGGPA
jgi:hypothetical protein